MNPLIDQIKCAFKNDILPKTVSDGCTRQICQDLEWRFRGKTRESLTNEEMRFLSTNLVLLNMEAFRYFFPTLLIASIQSPASLDFESFIQNVYYYPGIPDYQDYTRKRLECFTSEESAAILCCIQYWLQQPKLEEIWRQELQKSIPSWETWSHREKKLKK